MNYMQYYPVDVINGEGTRCTLFVAGCVHACKGCYNKKSWSFRAGVEYTQMMEDRIIEDLQDIKIKRQGLTLSGGDPMHIKNIPTLLKLVKRVKNECNNKDIWVWSGYKLSELNDEQKAILPYIDVLIDGKFIQELYNPSLLWRGSSNQVLYRFINGKAIPEYQDKNRIRKASAKQILLKFSL